MDTKKRQVFKRDWTMCSNPGEITPSYILHTCAFGTYLLGGGYLRCKKDYKVMVFYM
jgi:hypothetical protein